ncbi:MAG: tRNA (guanosine(46)-N7)-methyltransferase TrmB [Lachnospiraceae bacterium]
MRLRNISNAKEIIENSIFVVQNPQKYKGKWKDFFHRQQKTEIEIGMGKGRFLHKKALQNPDINYIGIELYDSVLLRAIQQREALEKETPLTNLYYLCIDARLLPEVFEKGEVSCIYLNFSDPWPKTRHAKRRLPSKEFLARYEQSLDQEGALEFKTDNRELFTFALEQIAEMNWALEVSTFDLHADPQLLEGNVMTEYEEKFSQLGKPIHKLIAKQK